MPLSYQEEREVEAMKRSLIEELSIRGQGLKANLRIISTLIFLVPSGAVAYIIANTKTTVQLEIYHIIMFIFTLVLVLVGMIILRQLFDEIIGITADLKCAEKGEKVIIDLNKSSSRAFAKSFLPVSAAPDISTRVERCLFLAALISGVMLLRSQFLARSSTRSVILLLTPCCFSRTTPPPAIS